MGKCFSRSQEGARGEHLHKKQNKDIDAKHMLKCGMDIMGRDLSVQIGYNRRAKKVYTDTGNREQPPAQNS